jgi:hypothetical protein
MTETHHVVVDGSNLATEGRTTPSLAQLDEAVRAYLAEDPSAEIVVVVDASFSHRIDPAERSQLEAAELHGEVVAPPAGAIGRGDAFVLRIAERTGAVVLSNDSFQEFHEEHPWLFEEGRLVGGKPVPGVGWIFTPRRPVRGPRSRKATRDADVDGDTDVDDQLSAPRKAAEVAKALKRATKAPASGRVKAAAKVVEAKPAKKKASKATTADKTSRGTKPVKAHGAKAHGAKAQGAKAQGAKKDKASLRVDSPRRAKGAPEAAAKGAKKSAGKDKPKVNKSAKAEKARSKKAGAPMKSATARRERRPVDFRAAIDQATEEVLAPSPPPGQSKPDDEKIGKGKRRRRVEPPPAVNEPLAFITFVAAHPLGSTFEGVVASFTSHGAMVDVGLGDGGVLHCYAPLAGLGVPAPRAAREVLTRGEHRDFSLVGLDPPRRMAELALPEFAPAFLGARSAGSKAAG